MDTHRGLDMKKRAGQANGRGPRGGAGRGRAGRTPPEGPGARAEGAGRAWTAMVDAPRAATPGKGGDGRGGGRRRCPSYSIPCALPGRVARGQPAPYLRHKVMALLSRAHERST
uniref:Uncharacterized protein n=1 Tax=Coturnix japonica TaxID=93934 RepID=A0A8C2YEH8_COTJA